MRYYQDISLELHGVLTRNGQSYSVPIHGGESVDHALFKISVAAHLLAWGYGWEQIRWEYTPTTDTLKKFRADLYVEGSGNLPSFWFECWVTESEKLREVALALPSFRVVRVVDQQRFKGHWTGESVVVGDHKRLTEIKDRKERKQLLLKEHESFVPPGCECWAVYARDVFPRIVYAVRGDKDGGYTYLHTGEGWGLSGFPYASRNKGRFEPLIPGLVGNPKWRGVQYEVGE